MAEWLERAVARRVELDTRTLAVFRVMLALLVLSDVALRARNLRYFYTDEGVVPVELASAAASDPAFSVYFLSGEPVFVAAAFAVTAAVAVQLAVGYHSRFATLLTFLLVVSLDLRNVFVLSYADTLLRLLLLFGVFLPLGERWSVDAVHRERAPRQSFVGVAGALALLQVVAVYLVNAAFKSVGSLWSTGEAAAVAFELDHVTWLLGPYLAEHAAFLTFAGWTWYRLLLLSPLLLVFHGRLRALVTAPFFLGHAAFLLTMRIGAFPVVAMTGLLLFLQREVWLDLRRVARRLKVEHGFQTLYRRMERGCVGFALALPRFTVDSVAVGVDSNGVVRARRWMYTAAVGLLVVYVALMAVFVYLDYSWTGYGLDNDVRVDEARERFTTLDVFFTVTEALAIDDQSWSVFTPEPPPHDWYHVYPAVTVDGDRADVFNDRPLSFEEPYGGDLHLQYDTYRERFYYYAQGRIHRSDAADELAVWRLEAEYLCRQGTVDGRELTHVNLYQVSGSVDVDGVEHRRPDAAEAFLVYRHGCGGRDAREIEPPEQTVR